MTVSRADLDAALPHVAAAPTTVAPITLLCLRPAPNRRIFPDRLAMTRAAGIDGDPSMAQPWLRLPDGRPDPRIQVSILPSRVLDLVWLDRSSTVHPGDPIVADLDTSEANLPVGTLLKAGSAVLRVSDEWNDGCAKWKVRYGADAHAWVRAHPALRLRGILCSVEADGAVTLADRIEVLSRP